LPPIRTTTGAGFSAKKPVTSSVARRNTAKASRESSEASYHLDCVPPMRDIIFHAITVFGSAAATLSTKK